MSENLNLSTGEGSWCYNDLASNCDEYGRLYDWITATTACPAGWSLPADGDWKNLEIALGMSDEEANTEDWRHDGNIATRVKSSTGWSTNGSGIDDSKFSIKPGGFRDGDGIYQYLTEEARLWTSTRDSNGDPWVRYLEYNNSGIYRKVRGISRGFSVRCIKR